MEEALDLSFDRLLMISIMDHRKNLQPTRWHRVLRRGRVCVYVCVCVCVCGRSLAGIVGLNHGCLYLVSVCAVR